MILLRTLNCTCLIQLRKCRKMRSEYKKLTRNTIIFSIGTFAQKAFAFVFTPFYTSVLTTQDYGVAAMCLSKAKGILNPSGHMYTEDNIDNLLEKRHTSQKIRRGGGKTSNPRKRTSEDDKRLLKNLKGLLK